MKQYWVVHNGRSCRRALKHGKVLSKPEYAQVWADLMRSKGEEPLFIKVTIEEVL